MADPVVTDAQAAVLALHASVVQGGSSTPERERERLLKDAEGAEDPQAFIAATIEKFAAEVYEAGQRESAQPVNLALTDEENEQLNGILLELRRISKVTLDLEKTRKRYLEQGIPLLRKRGSALIEDPTDGKLKVANVIEAQTLQVDAGELLAALVAHYDDEDQARVVWESVLKPPAVDTKDEGLFHQACRPVMDGAIEVAPAPIPPEVIVRVARYKPSSPYIGFAKPGG